MLSVNFNWILQDNISIIIMPQHYMYSLLIFELYAFVNLNTEFSKNKMRRKLEN